MRLIPAICAVFALMVSAGCAPMVPPPADAGPIEASVDASPSRCRPLSSRMSFVLARIGFVREDPMRAGVADGYDLDNRVSMEGDVRTCRHGDLVSPDGHMGIDNQLASLIPSVDRMTGGALDGAIQAAINNGQMLVVLRVEGIDDLCEDSEVRVSVVRVSGMPFVGSDQLVDSGQTFDLMRTAPMTHTTGRITGGTLELGPVDLPLPVAVLDAQFVIMFYGARLRVSIAPDGADGQGVIGGGISLAEFMSILSTLTIPNDLRTTVNGALTLFADLDRDAMGKCQRISGALRITTRPAFVLE
ncbi:MAG: hypothetical protein Q8Q09_17635 [Deltaproteobacteria bacterium]|nr:hypothetical protein [Deltaproteobacteria bacterium]